MRDEDLKNLPQSIEAWKIREFLDSLGIKHTDVYEMVVGVRSVEIGMYATDGKSAAEHRISIPFAGDWEKPADVQQGPYLAEDDELEVCPAWEKREGYRWRCARPLGHDGEHSYLLNTGWILGDAPQA